MRQIKGVGERRLRCSLVFFGIVSVFFLLFCCYCDTDQGRWLGSAGCFALALFLGLLVFLLFGAVVDVVVKRAVASNLLFLTYLPTEML